MRPETGRAERLRRSTRSLSRPQVAGTGTGIDWLEFCDAEAGWLPRSVQRWQRVGGFAHARAGMTLVAFRASWLALCATIPEHHLGLGAPALASARVTVDAGGITEGLVLRGSTVDVEARAEHWWSEVAEFLRPLVRGLEELGGPPASSDQYWGNAVGLIGEVLRRLVEDGADGDALATAAELRAATGREDLLAIGSGHDGMWSRRRTCCQLWRSGLGYCTECVLHESPARRQATRTSSPTRG